MSSMIRRKSISLNERSFHLSRDMLHQPIPLHSILPFHTLQVLVPAIHHFAHTSDLRFDLIETLPQLNFRLCHSRTLPIDLALPNQLRQNVELKIVPSVQRYSAFDYNAQHLQHHPSPPDKGQKALVVVLFEHDSFEHVSRYELRLKACA